MLHLINDDVVIINKFATLQPSHTANGGLSAQSMSHALV